MLSTECLTLGWIEITFVHISKQWENFWSWYVMLKVSACC